MTSSIDQKNGRYVQGGTVEQFPNRLGWWERKIMPRMNSDIKVTITSDLAGRPDLIAKLVYNNEQLMWIVLQYNTILDPRAELVTGAVIYLPSQERVI